MVQYTVVNATQAIAYDSRDIATYRCNKSISSNSSLMVISLMQIKDANEFKLGLV